MTARHLLGVGWRRRAYLTDTAPPPGLVGDGSLLDWRGRGRMTVPMVVGSANTDLVMNSPYFDFRADSLGLITTADGEVTQLTSLGGQIGRLQMGQLQSAQSNRPLHSIANSVVQFSGATASDDTTNGKWLTFPSASGDTAHLPRLVGGLGGGGTMQRGVAYLLVRFAVVPTWTTALFSVGTQKNTYADERNGAAVVVTSTGLIRAWRASSTAVTAVQTTAPVIQNEWVAIGFVWCDDRAVAGTSDNLPHLFVRTKAGGTWEGGWNARGDVARTWTTNSSYTEQVTGVSDWVARVGRAIHWTAPRLAADMRIHSLGVDLSPARDNAGIEANLTRLLARV